MVYRRVDAFKEYNSLFTDRSGIEKIIISQLGKIPAFSQLMDVKGQLAMLPQITAPPSVPSLSIDDLLAKAPEGTENILSGLHSSEEIDKIDANKIRQNIPDATATSNKKIDELQDRLASPKGNVQNMCGEMDSLSNLGDSLKGAVQVKKKEKDWQPNPLKTKRFVDRLNYGGNFQLDHKTSFFPASGSLGAQVSYQLHKNSSIGIGGTYIAGFGKEPIDISHKIGDMRANHSLVRHNGLGYRALLDCRIRGPLFIQGSFERNLRVQEGGFSWNHVSANDPTQWTTSMLLGIKTKIAAGKRGFQTIEILYDFHAHGERPAFVVRTGFAARNKHGIN